MEILSEIKSMFEQMLSISLFMHPVRVKAL